MKLSGCQEHTAISKGVEINEIKRDSVSNKMKISVIVSIFFLFMQNIFFSDCV